MQISAEIILLRPWWLLLLPIGFLLAWFAVRYRSESWRRICDPALLLHLIHRGDAVSTALTRCLIFVGWTLAVVALAGPAWDKEEAPLFQNIEAMVVVFDLSQSMNSTDMLPSRLERARYKAVELIEEHPDTAVGLVAFAGTAFDVTPVSDDIATVTHLLRSMDTSIMPIQGSRASEGLERARELLHRSGYTTGSVLLLTDGVDEPAYDAAESLKQSGYRLFVIGVGTSAGAPIILPGGEFLKDDFGDPIMAPIDQETMVELADTGGGSYISLAADGQDLNIRQNLFIAADSDAEEDNRTSTAEWKDRGPWFLILLLPLAAFMFRKGLLLGVIVLLPAGVPDAQAFEWSDLWQRPDQKAAIDIQQGNFETEFKMSDPNWKGIVHYRMGEFGQAAVEFAKWNDKIGLYNHGNALAKIADFIGAIEKYEAALQIDPEFEDAAYNLELVLQAMQQQAAVGRDNESSEDRESNRQNTENAGNELERLPSTANSDQQSMQREGDPSSRFGRQTLGGTQQEEGELDSADAGSEGDVLMQVEFDEEMNQIMEQWLRQIPHDPAGLLRRKFHFESSIRGDTPGSSTAW